MEEKTDTSQATDTSHNEAPKAAETAQSAPEAASSAPVTQATPGKGGKIAVALVLLIIVSGLVYAFMQQSGTEEQSATAPLSFDGSTPTPTFDEVPEVVATVNGEDITKDDYVTAYQQSYQTAVQQGADVSDPAVLDNIRSQTLDVLINTALIVQAANDTGVTVDADMVAEERAALIAQFGGEEGFAQALKTSGVTEAVLEDSIREQLLVEAYITGAVDAASAPTITDEAVQARYEEVAATVSDLPPLEEVRDQIVQQLEIEQQDVATQALVEELRAEASVSTFVDGE